MSTWYVTQQGQQHGPMTQEQVQQMAQAGSLGAQDYVAGPGLEGWVLASAVPLLAGAAHPGALAQPGPLAQPQFGAQPGSDAQAQFGTPPAQGAQPQFGAQPGSDAQAQFGAPPAQGAQPQFGTPPAQGGAAAQAQNSEKGDWVKERLKGLGAIGIAVLLALGNVATIYFMESFFPKTVIVAIGALFYGGWVVIFGDEYDDDTMELVRWKQIGMYASGGVGVLLGIGLSALLAS